MHLLVTFGMMAMLRLYQCGEFNAGILRGAVLFYIEGASVWNSSIRYSTLQRRDSATAIDVHRAIVMPWTLYGQ